MFLLRQIALIFALSFAFSGYATGKEQEEALPPIDQPPSVALIGARCVFCHGTALMLSFSRRLLFEGGPEALDDFLVGHHAPDDEAWAAIVQFLANPTESSN